MAHSDLVINAVVDSLLKNEYLVKTAEQTTKKKTNNSEKLIIGGIAGGLSTAAVQPLSQISNIKSTFGSNPQYKNRVNTYGEVIRSIFRGDTGEIAKSVNEYDKGIKGIKNFYHGLNGKLLQTIPQSAILLGANAILYKYYTQHKNRNNK